MNSLLLIVSPSGTGNEGGNIKQLHLHLVFDLQEGQVI